WECRRNEIKRDIEQFEIGAKPDPSTSTVAATYDGTNLNVVVTTAAGSLTLTSVVTLADGDGPHCVAIGMNRNSALINGCVQIPFMHDQIVNANQMGMVNQADPFYTVYPELWTKIANYAAWSWGISRLIDGIDQVKDQLNIDMTKVGVHGCSYAGKMALFGGALDERVTLTIAQESGGGGINSWRLSQNFVTRTTTQIEKIDNTNYSWFLPSMKALDAYSLPHDHHELIAMVAPRAFVTFGNRNYEWLGDESGYKSVLAAQQVWSALGAGEQFGYDFTTDHTHCDAAPSQVDTANAFANKVLHGQATDTNIAIPPDANPHTAGQAVFDLDESTVVNWTAPTLN
ncbi:MAG: beta-xylosidase/endoglucanase, partial [Pseudomonadota bacterium]